MHEDLPTHVTRLTLQGTTVLSLVPFIPNDSLVRCAHRKHAKNKLASFIHHLYTGGGLGWPEEPTVKLSGMNLRLISSLKVHGVPVPRAYLLAKSMEVVDHWTVGKTYARYVRVAGSLP